jgi:hypothetical protein
VCVGASLTAAPVLAKFGTFGKTKVVLPRVRPPATPVVAETVAVEVRSEGPEFTGAHVRTVRAALEEALSGPGLYRVVDSPRAADATVRVDLESLEAEIRDEVRKERRRVKVGEREEWNEKKKKYETKDVYADRDFYVSFRIVEGRIAASLEVDGGPGPRRSDLGSAYDQEFKEDTRVPPEAESEEALRRFLVEDVAARAAAEVAFAPDPVEVLLAVDGELKNGNRLAQAGAFRDALEEWSRLKLKGDKEAARLHNVGVAHEALAYAFPPQTPDHRSHLEVAREHYGKARELDPGEKYFAPPLERIETSLRHAASAATLAESLAAFREEKARSGEAGSRRREEPVGAKREARKPSAPPPGVLRNGSFESSLSPWTLTGKGSVVEEPGRGRVLEVVSGSESARAQQGLGIDLAAVRSALLGLDYRVTTGPTHLRVMLGYDDAQGRPRVGSLDVVAGATPGSWTSWSRDVLEIKPRPAKLTEIRIVVDGGAARIDNVALNPQ